MRITLAGSDIVACAVAKGPTTEEVIRAMAAEPEADSRLSVLVAGYDARDARRAANAAGA